MHPHVSSQKFSWPRRDDIYWMPLVNLITISVPTTKPRRIYDIEIDDLSTIIIINFNVLSFIYHIDIYNKSFFFL